MNKNLLLIGGLIVAGAVGAFFLLRKPAMQPGTMMAPGGRETVSSSFADLVKMGKDYTCTFESTDDAGTATNGTVYVANQGTQFSGEFTTQQTNGVAMKSNIIRDGEYAYFWSAADNKGYKMKIDPEMEDNWTGQTPDSQNTQNFDQTEPVDFECEPWRPDSALFVPPSNVEFMDMSAQMEMMQQQMEAMPSSAPGSSNGQYCGACAQLQGDSKAQCLAAMGC